MSQINVDTIKKADGTGSLTVPAESGTVVVKDGSNDVTLNNITATGVYLGGTGAANYLDDYEKGTWTPATGSATASSASGWYIKTGDLVMCWWKFTASTDWTFDYYVDFTGLPFSVDTSSMDGDTLMGNAGTNTASIGRGITFKIHRNDPTKFRVYAHYQNGIKTDFRYDDTASGFFMYFTA